MQKSPVSQKTLFYWNEWAVTLNAAGLVVGLKIPGKMSGRWMKTIRQQGGANAGGRHQAEGGGSVTKPRAVRFIAHLLQSGAKARESKDARDGLFLYFGDVDNGHVNSQGVQQLAFDILPHQNTHTHVPNCPSISLSSCYRGNT